MRKDHVVFQKGRPFPYPGVRIAKELVRTTYLPLSVMLPLCLAKKVMRLLQCLKDRVLDSVLEHRVRIYIALH